MTLDNLDTWSEMALGPKQGTPETKAEARSYLCAHMISKEPGHARPIIPPAPFHLMDSPPELNLSTLGFVSVKHPQHGDMVLSWNDLKHFALSLTCRDVHADCRMILNNPETTYPLNWPAMGTCEADRDAVSSHHVESRWVTAC